MANNNRRHGFTLIEVLIVAVMLAVLAAIIIPQVLDSSADVEVSNAKFSLHTLRSQIQRYKSEHHGKVPSDDLAELFLATNTSGTTDSIDGPLVHGPYIESTPKNPFTGSASVVEITNNPPTSADVTTSDGWLYNKADGQVWLNHPDYIAE